MIQNFMREIMNRLRKLFNNLSINENKSTINVLNNDCIKQIIKKLSIEEILILEKVDKRFELCVKEVFEQQKVLCFAKYGIIECKHSANNLQTIYREFDIKSKKIKTILKKCPNIECLQMSYASIKKSLIEWISNNCKQLVCLHLYRPTSKSKSPQIDFEDIGKLLSDKIEIEFFFGNRDFDMNNDSIIALIQNMPQIRDISFGNKLSYISILESAPYLIHNIRSLSCVNCELVSTNDFNALKNNTNLIELSLNCCSQQIFDFVCDNFTQLKSFSVCDYGSVSMSKLIKLINLEYLELCIKIGLRSKIMDNKLLDIEFSSMDQNYCSNKLLSLKLNDITMTPTLFERLLQMFPNIEKLSFNYFFVICEHQNKDEYDSFEFIVKYDCFECIDKVFECLSKLNSLKVLEIIPFYCQIIRVIERNINEHTLKQLVELKLCFDGKKIDESSKQLFLNLIQSLTQLCDRNNKLLFTLRINAIFVNLISEKKTINGVKYMVFLDCEKFEESFGTKFEIPKNMRIIRWDSWEPKRMKYKYYITSHPLAL
jgi:hypothetical protein